MAFALWYMIFDVIHVAITQMRNLINRVKPIGQMQIGVTKGQGFDLPSCKTKNIITIFLGLNTCHTSDNETRLNNVA